MRNIFIHTLSFLIWFTFFQGTTNTPIYTQPLNEDHKTIPVKQQSPSEELVMISHFLAGLPKQGLTKEFEKFTTWQSYCSSLDDKWNDVTKNRIDQMNKWREDELGDVCLPVFYPMGGPDVFNLLTFFPNSPMYTIVGLEPIFNLQTLEDIKKEEFANELVDYLQQSMDSLFKRSFFISKDMSVDLKKFGVAPVIVALITRLKYEIIDFKIISYNKANEKSAEKETPSPEGLKIIFRKKGSNNIQKLHYFRKNLHNTATIGPFLEHLETKAPIAVMFKSTSYTLHDKEFSQLSSFVQKNAALVLQDDTGLPYEILKKYWEVTLYGEYVKPYGDSFKDFVQPDLASEYQTNSSIKKLDFRIGYGYGKAPSCLMIGRKKIE
jgi:hypothetical protein